jgi:hypothetical protein
MSQILKFLPVDNFFDAETMTALGLAYDLAMAKVYDGKQPGVCGLIAQRIVAAATNGERDPEKLCQFALRGIPKRK